MSTEQQFQLKVNIKEEMIDDRAMTDQLFAVKEEPPSDDKEWLTFVSNQLASPSIVVKRETCECTGPDCLHCIEADRSKEMIGNDISTFESLLGDDSDRMPRDWFLGASSDSEEATVDDASVSNFPIKVESPSDDKESLSTFASPSIIVKGETCPCTGDCPDCQAKRSHPCPECGKTFSSNADLIRHLRVHTGERPYVCSQCTKAFKRIADLTRHQATHQTVRSRPFRCPAEGCGKAFTTKQKLTVHFRLHTGDKPYKCDRCGKPFTQRGELTLHYRLHTGERPYSCPLCPKTFARLSHAKWHQRTVHPESL